MQTQEKSQEGFTSLEKCLQNTASEIISEFDSNNRQISVEEQIILCREVPCKVLLSSKNILHMAKKRHIKKMIAEKKPITKKILEKLDKKYAKQSAKLYRDHWLKRQDEFERIDKELARLYRMEMILYLEHRKDLLSKNQDLTPSILNELACAENQMLTELEPEENLPENEEIHADADVFIADSSRTKEMNKNGESNAMKIITEASLSLDFDHYSCGKQNEIQESCLFSYNKTQPTQSQPSYNDFTYRLESRGSELPITSTQEMLSSKS